MDFLSLPLFAISLSLDACAVALTNGLTSHRNRVQGALKMGFFFGFFQMLMPLIGFYAGRSVHQWIAPLDHWVVFFMLLLIGANMIRSSFSKQKEDQPKDLCETKTLLLLALATSIDALAVGISFAMMGINIWLYAPVIGVVTFFLSAGCVLIGGRLGKKIDPHIENLATRFGGLVLIGIGIKTLVEHMFF